MFDDDEDDDDFLDGNLSDDIANFEAYLNGGELGFIDSDRLEAMIDHFLINNQYSKAKLCAEYALSLYSFNVLFHLRLAQAMSAMGQLKEALSVIAKIEKNETPSCELKLTKASIFSQLRDTNSAIKYFKEALLLSDPEDKDEIYLDLAMEYENKNDYKGAINVLREAIQYNPKNEGAIYEIAFCYDQQGDYEKAVKCYSDFIDENPYSFTAWYNLGNTYSKAEDYDKAIWAYDYCVLINEGFGPVYFNLGNAYLSQEKYQLAIDNFNKCIELDGEDPIALCYIGEAHEQLGELALAKQYYRQSLDLAPMLPDAWLGLGIVEDLEGNTREALTFIHKAADLDPENAGIYSVLAGAYEKLEEFEKAQEFYLLSLELDPNDEECLVSYIDMLTGLSVIDAAEILNAFINAHPYVILAKVLKVNLLWNLGKKQEAIQLFAECVAEDREVALLLFENYPDFKNIQQFVDLAEE